MGDNFKKKPASNFTECTLRNCYGFDGNRSAAEFMIGTSSQAGSSALATNRFSTDREISKRSVRSALHPRQMLQHLRVCDDLYSSTGFGQALRPILARSMIGLCTQFEDVTARYCSLKRQPGLALVLTISLPPMEPRLRNRLDLQGDRRDPVVGFRQSSRHVSREESEVLRPGGGLTKCRTICIPRA